MHIEKHIKFLLATDLFKNFKEEELSDLFKEECYRISLYKKKKSYILKARNVVLWI
ncbi:hypothetical protein GOM49_02920 [Clostridium bovifaecis]|uniref:Uncharacterized protein n=1 Tax=Clostridium bovifaecis TaxID=2184719 RepID=A0A6I6EZ12_9CLOT|nr:hypothetical protein GOM49_02920 [Clostridium bovifaecis]